MPEDVGAVVAVVACAYRKRYNSCRGENEIHYYRHCLELVDNALEDCCKNAVKEDCGEECAIDGAVRGSPVAVTDDDDEREEHEREAIYGR